MQHSSDFEQHLRRLVPVGTGDLTEDTFYRAGWNAAEKALAQRVPATVSKRRACTLFASGMLCGLLVSAVNLTAWPLSTRELSSSHNERRMASVPEPAPIASEPTDVPEQSPVAASVATAESRRTGVASLTAAFLPWYWQPDSRVEERIPVASRSLSPAARYAWSSLLRPEPTRWQQPASTTADSSWSKDNHTMRSFPLTGAMIEELL